MRMLQRAWEYLVVRPHELAKQHDEIESRLQDVGKLVDHRTRQVSNRLANQRLSKDDMLIEGTYFPRSDRQ